MFPNPPEYANKPSPSANLQMWWVSGTQAAQSPMCYGPGWTLHLHAFIEQTALADLAQEALLNNPEDFWQANPPDNWDIARPQYGEQGGTITKLWRCPSARTSEIIYSDPVNGIERVRKGNYAVNFGGGTFTNAIPGECTRPVNPDQSLLGAFGIVSIVKYPLSERNGLGKGTRLQQFFDGASNTVAISEVLTWDAQLGSDTWGPNNDDWRGVWILPGIGANTFTARTTPNSTVKDRIPGCGTNIPAGHPLECDRSVNSGVTWAAARSRHSNGVNVAMADGAVRFFSNTINGENWKALSTRAAGDTAAIE
jgi:prepilin-type processing-associated H-X9-DG protein